MSNKNCYIYTRVSTARQVDGYSLDGQKQALINYAKYKDLHISGIYSDAGKSGKDIIGRPSFMQMMADIKSQKDKVSYVLVFKLSRFGRNSADILRSIQEIKDYDVDLVSVKEAIDSSTKGGKLMLSILSGVAEMEKENINAQFSAGKFQKVYEGGFPGGVVPYGFRCKDKELVIEQKEADDVKKMFEMYLSDKENLSSIARAFNLPDRHIAKILSNPIYCGRLYYNRRTNKKDINGKAIIKDKDEVIKADSIVKPIVSKELFAKVQAKREQLALPLKNKVSNIHILSGLIKCPVCGKRLCGSTCKNKSRVSENYGKPYYSYHCSHASRGNCTFNLSINQEDINYYVFEAIKNLEFYKEFNDAISFILKSKDELVLLNKKLKELKMDLEDSEIAKDKIAEKLDGLNPLNADYDNKYNKLSLDLDKCYDKIDEIEEAIKETRKEIELTKLKASEGQKCKDYLISLNKIFDKMSDKEKKELCNLLIDHIEIDKDTRNVKAIIFKIPVSLNSQNISFVLDRDNINISPKVDKPKGTYGQIQKYIKEKYKVKVHTSYIAQIKRKYGVEVGTCYNKPKSDKSIVHLCPKEKEEMILDAFRYFEIEFKEDK